MAGPSAWLIYNQFKTNIGKKLLDLSVDTFKVALFTSPSSAINVAVSPATYTAFAADGNEVANGNGYTTTGVSVGVGTWTGTSTLTFDSADATWTASGAGFTARAAVLYDSTSAGKEAVCYCLLDSTPANVTVSSPNTLTLQIANILTLT
jgi:hypothetical protein